MYLELSKKEISFFFALFKLLISLTLPSKFIPHEIKVKLDNL